MCLGPRLSPPKTRGRESLVTSSAPELIRLPKKMLCLVLSDEEVGKGLGTRLTVSFVDQMNDDMPEVSTSPQPLHFFS